MLARLSARRSPELALEPSPSEGKGAAIGAASGGVLGLATVLLTRGPEIQLGVGDSVEMVLERTLTIEQTKVNRAAQ